MSSFSGSTKNKKNLQKKPLGLESTRLDTNQQAVPLPLVYGRMRLGVTFVSNAFNQRTKKVKEDTGKDEITVGFNYYASFAALVCHGPVDAIREIWFDDEKVWPKSGTGMVRDAGEDWIPIDVAGNKWTWYWGTETQTFDPLLLTISPDKALNPTGVVPPNVPEEHPAYVGQCYFVAENHFLGYQHSQTQNIEVVVERYPRQTWMGYGEIFGDATIPGVLVDSLTNIRYGLSIPDGDAVGASRIDRAGIVAVNEALDAEGFGVSVLLDRVEPWSQWAARLLEHCDGYFLDTKTGLFTLGLIRGVPCADPDLPRFTEEDLIELPEIDASGWVTTQNDVRVVFTNRDNKFQEDSTRGDSNGSLQMGGQPSLISLERPYITRADVADKIARTAAKIFAFPNQTGRLLVRKSRMQNLQAGGGFYLSYGDIGLCWLHAHAISVRVGAPEEPIVEIEFEADRHYAVENSKYVPPVYDPPVPIIQPVVPIDLALVLEAPFVPNLLEVPLGLFLARRPTELTTKFKVWRNVGSATYEELSDVGEFPAFGILQDNIDLTGGILYIQFDEFSEIVTGVSSSQADNWLMFIDDEIFTVYGAEKITGERMYQFEYFREKYDTAKQFHGMGAHVYLISSRAARSCIYEFQNTALPAGTVSEFKLQPFVLGSAQDLAQLGPPHPVTWTDRVKKPWKPRNVRGPASFNTNTTQITIQWDLNNRSGRPTFDIGLWNPVYKVDLRPVNSDFTYPNVPAPIVQKESRANDTSMTFTKAELGGLFNGSIVARVWAWQQGFLSHTYSEITINRV